MTNVSKTVTLICFLFATVFLALESNNAFSASTLKVTTPNGGEEWDTGTKYTIKWKKGNGGTRVKIELLKSGKVYQTIKKATKNDGRYRWKIPSSVKTSSKYKIKITSIKKDDVTDSSNKNFTITKTTSTVSTRLKVTSPNGGETWKQGSTYTIKWDKGTGPASDATHVGIKLYEGSSDGRSALGTLIKTIEADPGEEERTPIKENDGRYSWTIPEDLDSGSEYEIRIKAKNPDGIVEEDASNTAFTISTGGNLSLTSSAFKNGKKIPKKYTCDGGGTKLAFTVSDLPNGTKSLILFLDDLDGTPTKTNTNDDWNHWVLYIPKDVKKIRRSRLPNRSVEGTNDANDRDFDPICPPGGKNDRATHTYRFTLYALDTKLDVDPDNTRSTLVTKMKGYLLEKTTLSGDYGDS